jgi:hypothetical protein
MHFAPYDRSHAARRYRLTRGREAIVDAGNRDVRSRRGSLTSASGFGMASGEKRETLREANCADEGRASVRASGSFCIVRGKRGALR